MSGFTNDIMNADNVNFSGVDPTIGEVTSDGQLMIGSSVAPNIRVNTLTEGPGIDITNANGSITIGLSGGLDAIQTIDGDTGTGISGNTVSITALNTAGGSVKFNNNGTASTLNFSDSNANTFLGQGSGNQTVVGTSNICLGVTAGQSLTTGFNNCIVASGGGLVTSGHDNLFAGQASGNSVVSGSFNTFVGVGSGTFLEGSSSSNIYIGNQGTVTTENNKIVIGEDGSGDRQQNYCQIAGILGNTVSNPLPLVIDSSTGQIGTQTITPTPCFLVSLTNTLFNITGDGTVAPIQFDTIIFDNGSNITLNDSGKTIFTAPITGKYLISANLSVTGGVSGSDTQIRITATSRTFFVFNKLPFLPSISAIVDMSANDTVYIEIYDFDAGMAKDVDVAGNATNPISWMSGYLLA